jgi:uncharacterized membrane protein
MHYLMGSEMGWAAVPFIVAVGVVYTWLAGLLVNRTTKVSRTEHMTKDVKISRAA